MPGPRVGRAYVILLSGTTGYGRILLSDTEIPLDPDAPWTRCVAEIVAAKSGGTFSKGRVLRLVREARTAADVARWPR